MEINSIYNVIHCFSNTLNNLFEFEDCMLLNALKLCFIGLLISFMSCNVVIDESRCGQAATDFANMFNRQDYRSAIRLFRSGELDGGQYKRLENNFK